MNSVFGNSFWQVFMRFLSGLLVGLVVACWFSWSWFFGVWRENATNLFTVYYLLKSRICTFTCKF